MATGLSFRRRLEIDFLTRVVDEDDFLSFELVKRIDPCLVSTITFQSRRGVSLVSIQSITSPGAILARIFRWKITAPESVALVLVFLVHFAEATVVFSCDPPVVMILVADADLELANLRLL